MVDGYIPPPTESPPPHHHYHHYRYHHHHQQQQQHHMHCEFTDGTDLGGEEEAAQDDGPPGDGHQRDVRALHQPVMCDVGLYDWVRKGGGMGFRHVS
jgi:hypothetical protein